MTDLPPIGSKWRERKPYDYRVVEVVCHDSEGYVLIRHAGRTTKAKASRFGRDYKREILPGGGLARSSRAPAAKLAKENE